MSFDLHGRTQRLELADQNLRSFEAVVLEATPEGIVLSRSAFYPGANRRIREFSGGRARKPGSRGYAKGMIST
ncbi:hypothetical protein [Nonomuraea sp. NPDC046570]|uniref:hypothetical protein n=1 Tax=Nonomuraea sp. NPDC046570 TaxID=3155255 RepID=UPI0033F7B482